MEKYNEIQLTKNKRGLNNQKMKNHPPSPDNYLSIIINSSKLQSHQPTRLSRLERLLCTCSCAVRKRKYHSVWLQEMGNSCKNVFQNTLTWEQQE